MEKQPVWLTRDVDSPTAITDSDMIEVHDQEPIAYDTPEGTIYEWRNFTVIVRLCVNMFKLVTGFELEPGECKKVMFHVEVLDD